MAPELEISDQKFDEIVDHLNSIKKGKTANVRPVSRSGAHIFLVEGEPVVVIEYDDKDSRVLLLSDKLHEELLQTGVVFDQTTEASISENEARLIKNMPEAPLSAIQYQEFLRLAGEQNDFRIIDVGRANSPETIEKAKEILAEGVVVVLERRIDPPVSKRDGIIRNSFETVVFHGEEYADLISQAIKDTKLPDISEIFPEGEATETGGDSAEAYEFGITEEYQRARDRAGGPILPQDFNR